MGGRSEVKRPDSQEQRKEIGEEICWLRHDCGDLQQIRQNRTGTCTLQKVVEQGHLRTLKSTRPSQKSKEQAPSNSTGAQGSHQKGQKEGWNSFLEVAE